MARIRPEQRKPARPLYHPGPPITNEASLAGAIAALRARDPGVIGALLDACGPVPLRASTPGFAGLASIIIRSRFRSPVPKRSWRG